MAVKLEHEMMESPFAKEKKGPKIVAEIRLKRHANGDLAAMRYHENYDHAPETKAFKASQGKEFMAHVAKHMGIKHEMEPEAESAEGEDNAGPSAA